MTEDSRSIDSRVAELLRVRSMFRTENDRKYRAELVEIGDFSYAHDLKVRTWGEGSKLHIGKFCSIADNVQVFLGGEHHTEWCTTYPFNVLMPDAGLHDEKCAKTKGDVRIGNDVWIGMDAKIMSGVIIRDGAVIGAGAVVTHDVMPYEIVGGVPAKHIRWRIAYQDQIKLLSLAWWDWPVEKIAEALELLTDWNVLDLEKFSREYDGRTG